MSRSAAARLDPRPPGDALPEEDSNPHSRSNNPTSFRLDDLASSTATGSRTPASGLRARRLGHLDHRGVAEAVGLAPTRARTPTCFRDRLLIWPGHFLGRKGRDSHPHGLAARTRVAGGLLIWPVPFLEWGPRWASHPRPRPYRGRALPSLSYEGLASPARLERATPAFGKRCSRSTELRRDARRRQGSNLHPPVS